MKNKHLIGLAIVFLTVGIIGLTPNKNYHSVLGDQTDTSNQSADQTSLPTTDQTSLSPDQTTGSTTDQSTASTDASAGSPDQSQTDSSPPSEQPVTTTTQNATDASEVLPPTAPIIISATSGTVGVTISWQAAQMGSFAVSSYQLYKEVGEGQFGKIADVEAPITSYVDSQGNTGDVYKLTASDNQQPANVSSDSDEITATDPAPSSAQATPSTSPPIPQVTNNYVPPDLPSGVKPQEVIVNNLDDVFKNLPPPLDTTAAPSNDQLNQIQKLTTIETVQLQAVAVQGKQNLVAPVINTYTSQLKQVVQIFDSLQPAQQAQVKNSCDQQVQDLETAFSLVPEENQVDLLTALAQCRLIGGEL